MKRFCYVQQNWGQQKPACSSRAHKKIPPNCGTIVNAEFVGPGGLRVALVEPIKEITDILITKCIIIERFSKYCKSNINGVTSKRGVNIGTYEPVL